MFSVSLGKSGVLQSPDVVVTVTDAWAQRRSWYRMFQRSQLAVGTLLTNQLQGV